MKKILVGYIGKGKTSGIDKYLLNFIDKVKNNNTQIDLLTRLYDEKLETELEKKGCRLYHVARNRHFIRQYKEMKKIINENNYDIAYFNISETYDCVGLLAAKTSKVQKIIAHSHNSNNTGKYFFIRVLKRLLNAIFKPVVYYCSNQYLACSDLAAKWLYPRKIYKTQNYELIYNSVDFDKFKYDENKRKKIRNQLDLNDKFVLGFVGRFNKQKNTNFLIDILQETIKEKKNAVLLCVGEGEELEGFKSYASKKNVLNNIVFAGTVDNTYDYYQAFDVFLLPSLYEGLPIVGVEAQISGCPFLCSDKITKNAIIGENSYQLSIKKADIWKDKILSINKRENKLSTNANNFDLKNTKQFNIITDKNHKDISDKSPILLLFYLLSIHYLLNITNYFNGFNILLILCAFLMFFISLYYLKIYRKIIKENILIILLLFLIDYIFTFLLFPKYNIIGSIKNFIWMSILLLFVFGYKKERKKEICRYEITNIMIFNMIFISIINLFNYGLLILNVKEIIKSFYGDGIVFGMSSWNRFYGLYYDPNYASILSSCAIIFALYLIKKCNKYLMKILLIISIYINSIILLYGQSRTGLLCLIIGLIIYVTMCIYCDRKKINLKKILMKVLCVFSFFVFLFLSIRLINYYCLGSHSKESIIELNNKEENEENEKNKEKDIELENIIFKRSDLKNGDISNRRFSIWKSGIEIYNKNKLIGIGFSNIKKYAIEKMPKTYIVNNDFTIFEAFHNMPIDVLVSQGIIGILIVCVFFVMIFIRVIKNIKIILNDYIMISLFSCLTVIFCSSFLVSEIFYINNACSFMFWLIMGYFYYLISKEGKNE